MINYEVNSLNDPLVRNIPTLRSYTVTNFVGGNGQSFRFKVTSYNKEGSTDSQFASILLAGPPLAPIYTPVLVQDNTDDT